MMMKIVFTDYYYPNIEQEIAVLSQMGDVEIVDCSGILKKRIPSEKELMGYVSDADAIIVQFAKITEKVILSMKKCKIIARYAIGVDTIDVAAAHKAGIVVSNVPDYCIEEVSDTALAHMYNCTRKITFSRDLMMAGEFSFERIAPMRRFADLDIGLLGFGNIARCLARKIRPLCHRIMAYDPYISDFSEYSYVEFVPLEKILGESDILSIHVPLNKMTQHMLSDDQFSIMKDGISIINTARGEVIDEGALLRALDQGKVSYCGLDVLQTEEFHNSSLSKHPRVAVTPHIGWHSAKSIKELQRKTALNVYNMLTKGSPLYKV
jgi:D-3-phosphoglycerate dehydrogenase